jgi:hypothetical protein
MATDQEPATEGDELVALCLQLEQLMDQQEEQELYVVDSVPDLELAYTVLRKEVEVRINYLRDRVLAGSIASAVATDAPVISNLAQQDCLIQVDRDYTLELSRDDPELESPPEITEPLGSEACELEKGHQVCIGSGHIPLWADSETDTSGPISYTQCQAEILGKLSNELFQCCACTGSFRWVRIVRLECGDQYCQECLKRQILRAVVEKDLALLPPRCHGTPVPTAVIARLLEPEELEAFSSAQVEKISANKTYCHICAKFILPGNIHAGAATCPHCTAMTCHICKSAAHGGDCPEDPDIQATMELGTANQWQRCYSCRALVELDRGCNHMT